MTNHQISGLLDELQSKEAYIRSDAIKKIIKGKINDEQIIQALKDVIANDPAQAVRNFARAALDVFGIEHSEVESDTQANKMMEKNPSAPPETLEAQQLVANEETTQTPLMPFWSNGKKKLLSIFFIAIAVFILTLPYSILSIFLLPILKFPTGLVVFVNNKADYDAIFWGNNYDGFNILVWIFYIGMANAIVLSNKRKVVVCLYSMLILLLILNVAGCQIIGPVIEI